MTAVMPPGETRREWIAARAMITPPSGPPEAVWVCSCGHWARLVSGRWEGDRIRLDVELGGLGGVGLVPFTHYFRPETLVEVAF